MEMFPEPVRSVGEVVGTFAIWGVKTGFTFSKNALWIATTSAAIMVLPIVFETERAQQQEQELKQQRQVWLAGLYQIDI